MSIKVGEIEFDPGQVIGWGPNGTVVLRGAYNQKQVAVKCLLKCQLEVLASDFDIFSSKTHVNVLRLLHMVEEKDFM